MTREQPVDLLAGLDDLGQRLTVHDRVVRRRSAAVVVDGERRGGVSPGAGPPLGEGPKDERRAC